MSLAASRYPTPVSSPDCSESGHANSPIKMGGLRDLSTAAPLTAYNLPLTTNHLPTPPSYYTPPPQPSLAPTRYGYGGGQFFDGGSRQTHAGQGGGHQYSRQGQAQPQQEESRRSHHWHAWSRPSLSSGLHPSPPPQEWRPGQQYAGNWYAPQSQFAGQQQNWWASQYPQPLTPPYYPAAPQQYLPPTNQHLNANAPAFTPINRQALEFSQETAGPVSAVPIHEKKGRKSKREKKLERLAALAAQDQNHTALTELQEPLQAAQEQIAQHATPKSKYDPRQAKRVRIIQPPVPNPTYLHYATQPPQLLDISRPLLVILDLNGTLLRRKQLGGNNAFTARPHLYEFLEYLFSNHTVMVWSSSKPENVAKMCSDLFTREQRSKLAAVWGRDTLRIPSHAYNMKVQVYKQLSWVWSDAKIQASNPVPGGVWTQANTVLIDDSVEKSASEPYNLVELEEFEAKPHQMKTDILGQVALYLDDLRSQRDVSAYIRLHPFVYDPNPPAAVPSLQREIATYG